MQLESLRRLSMYYAAGSWHRPFGFRAGDEEALGFGHSWGVVAGEIEV
jgi:hypothetical protein